MSFFSISEHWTSYLISLLFAWLISFEFWFDSNLLIASLVEIKEFDVLILNFYNNLNLLKLMNVYNYQILLISFVINDSLCFTLLKYLRLPGNLFDFFPRFLDSWKLIEFNKLRLFTMIRIFFLFNFFYYWIFFAFFNNYTTNFLNFDFNKTRLCKLLLC